MLKVLANDGIHAYGKDLMEKAGITVDTTKIPQDELINRLQDYDGIIVRSATKVTKELIDVCPNLKVIARGGVGLDNIDVDYAKSKGIPVYNTPAASSLSVAELALGHMMNLSRFLHRSNRFMPEHGKSEFKVLKKAFSGGNELAGKTLGIIGLGRIGQEMSRIALALRMKVLPVDPIVKEATIKIDLYATEDIGLTVTLKTVPMDEMLAHADYLTIHVPFAGGTSIIGRDEIAQMKKGAFIINTSRGGVVEEKALIEALESGHLGGAGLDVFMNEPSPDNRLLNMKTVSISPHIGASTHEAQRNIGIELAEKIIDFLIEI